jgi:hypothetical protein
MSRAFVFSTPLLAAIAFLAAERWASAQGVPDVILKLTAKVEDGRFVGIDVADLDKVHLVPGDLVTVRIEGAHNFNAEMWSRRYTWEKKEKRKKKEIITTMTQDADVTWQATWGSGVEGILTLGEHATISYGAIETIGNTKNEKKEKVVVLSRLMDRTVAHFQIADEVKAGSLQMTVKPEPDRVVDRPDDVPASASKLKATPSEDQPPKIDVLVAQGEDLGRVVLKITRPAATKSP